MVRIREERDSKNILKSVRFWGYILLLLGYKYKGLAQFLSIPEFNDALIEVIIMGIGAGTALVGHIRTGRARKFHVIPKRR